MKWEEWMHLVMASNLQNINKQKTEQSEACNQFAIRRDYEVCKNIWKPHSENQGISLLSAQPTGTM